MFNFKYFDRIYKDKPYAWETLLIKRYLKDGKVLDVGGGTGKRANLLNRFGFQTTVLDPSNEALNIASKKGVLVYRGIIDHPEFDLRTDNIIMMFNVMGFLVNPYLAFENIHKSLKKGGRLIFDYWNYDVRKKGFSFKWDGLFTRITYKRWFGDICEIDFWFPFKWFHEKHRVMVYPPEMIDRLLKPFKVIKRKENKYETLIVAEK